MRDSCAFSDSWGRGTNLTASAFTAEFAARFARGGADTRPKAEAPAQLLPFTAIAVATAYALLFVPPSNPDFGEVSAAGLLACALLGLGLAAPSFPRIAAIGIPVGYIALVALLREAAGGSSSGFGGLLLLPVLWLAVTAGRRELAAVLFAMAVAQLLPLGLVGPPRYPASGFRGAFVLTTVAAITGLMVQRLVTETREQNERLRELDHLKDEFVATASHELRTPLTSLSGYLEMSLDPAEGSLSPTRENHLRIAQRNAGRLTMLVDQLLFLARADSHPLELRREPVDLAELLTEAAETARPAARAKNIVLEVEAQPRRAMGDRPQLVRVVDNLVTNAVKFTPDGGTVRLTARDEGGAAVLEVTDTGVGVPPADRPDLFNRFFRGRNAIEEAVPGSGLGLAISQVIAEAHGSTIEVESAPEGGSTFRLALPLA
jgi:signal transduction histidine kinase